MDVFDLLVEIHDKEYSSFKMIIYNHFGINPDNHSLYIKHANDGKGLNFKRPDESRSPTCPDEEDDLVIRNNELNQKIDCYKLKKLLDSDLPLWFSLGKENIQNEEHEFE